MLFTPIGRLVHQRGRPQVRQMTDYREKLIVLAWGKCHHVGPEPRQEAVKSLIVGRAGAFGRSQYPPAAFEEPGLGGLDPLLFGAGHRVPADESDTLRQRLFDLEYD